jgi:hypothetical protein
VAEAVVVLTERALEDRDAAHLASLYGGGEARLRVLVPADLRRPMLADILNHLSLLELREALDAVRGHDETSPAQAGKALERSLAALAAHGLEATGEVVPDGDGQPLAALQEQVAGGDVREVVVITRPHAVEDTFHTDWASQARKRLGLPVLHVYAGSTFLG